MLRHNTYIVRNNARVSQLPLTQKIQGYFIHSNFDRQSIVVNDARSFFRKVAINFSELVCPLGSSEQLVVRVAT